MRANRQVIEWYLLGTAWLIAFLLGLIGFIHHAALLQLNTTFWDHLYLTFQLVSFNSGAVENPIPLELNIARFLIPLLTGAAALKAFWSIFREQLQMAQLLRLQNHIIICGLSRKGYLLAVKFRQQGDKVVVIELSEENPLIPACRELGMIVLTGNAADELMLKRAGIAHAHGVIVVCDQDEVNAEIALQLDRLLENSPVNLNCLVHISDPQLCILLKEQEKIPKGQTFRIELFNIYEQGARLMLNACPISDQPHSEPAPQILLIGLGRMGESLVIHAARDWWAARKKGSDQKICIQIIDRHAGEKIRSLFIRQPHLAQVCDLLPLEMEIHSSQFEQAAFLWGEQGRLRVSRIYICFDNDALALNAGLSLYRQVKNNPIPIVMRMAESSGLSRLIDTPDSGQAGKNKLLAFCLLDKICTPEILTHTTRDILARASHELFLGQDPQDPNIVSEFYAPSAEINSQWQNLPEADRLTHYLWVDHIHALLDSTGYEIIPLFDLDASLYRFSHPEIESMAALEHDLWRRDKVQDGWHYADGPENEQHRTRPDLIAWDELSPVMQKNIRRLVQSIPAFLVRAGYQVNKKII
jgi:hypothetical protein